MLSIGEWEKVSYSTIICVLFNFYKISYLSLLSCSSLEGSVIQISHQGLRKVLYQKVCLFFSISSTELSTHADVRCRSWLRSLRDGCLLAKYLEMVRFFLFVYLHGSYRRGSSERNEEKTGKRSDGTRDRWVDYAMFWFWFFSRSLWIILIIFFSFLFSFELTIERLIT